MNQDNEILIKVDGVSKKFCRDLKKSLWYGIKDVASELLPINHSKSKIQHSSSAAASEHSKFNIQHSTFPSPHLRDGEFWAVKDVSFELRRGECIGLIGRNGAGKTTLLKMLNGLIKPDEGSIEMHGRVGALIALGAGFNPILTGRENIYVNGSILGLTKEEIDAKIDDIIDFAEISEFIDSPVQSYSSGMQVRLGFAVATALDPDVLILDEVLAVGDAAFRNKCYNRISKMQKKAAVIFVSHSMEQVARICTHGMFLKKGQTIGLTNAEHAIQLYESDNVSGDSSEERFSKFQKPVLHAEFEIINATLEWQNCLHFSISLNLEKELHAPFMRLFFFSQDGSIAAEWNSEQNQIQHDFPLGESKWTIKTGPLPLKPGKYTLSLIFHEHGSIGQPLWFHKTQTIEITGKHTSGNVILLAGAKIHTNDD